ncbi:MAG: hypothetical protein GDA50_04015 [Alphaproteobacteria bacterium GM202ARS2]|nr:hypothetical protein [Alphaproteobacteria bacterium GM202ARS2]
MDVWVYRAPALRFGNWSSDLISEKHDAIFVRPPGSKHDTSNRNRRGLPEFKFELIKIQGLPQRLVVVPVQPAPVGCWTAGHNYCGGGDSRWYRACVSLIGVDVRVVQIYDNYEG